MKLVRCPSCRTVNRVNRSVVCAGCDRNLDGVVARERPMPAVLREAERDVSAVWGMLIVLAVLACFSAISMKIMVKSLRNEDFGTALFTTATSIGLVGFLLWIPMKRRASAKSGDPGCATLGGLFVLAAIGAVILVIFICATFG